MPRFLLVCSAALCLAAGPSSYNAQRAAFETRLRVQQSDASVLPTPPPELFTIERYAAPLGPQLAYVGVRPSGVTTTVRQPAMVWLSGGLPAGGMSESAWTRQQLENDQSAKSYREHGIVMMYPTLRGTYGNPGHVEGFLGEVDDVLAAIEHLRGLDYVDADRVYLGGHSTGGTLALLAAATGVDVAGVFAFGPASDPGIYEDYGVPWRTANKAEATIRAPIHHVHGIAAPTWIIEGDNGNVEQVSALGEATKDHAWVHVAIVSDANHYDVLGPVNELIAGRIAGTPPGSGIDLDNGAIVGAFQGSWNARNETVDLQNIAWHRSTGLDIQAPCRMVFTLRSDHRFGLRSAAERLAEAGMETSPLAEVEGTDGTDGTDGTREYGFMASQRVKLSDVSTVLDLSARVHALATELQLTSPNWSCVHHLHEVPDAMRPEVVLPDVPVSLRGGSTGGPL